MSWAPAFLTNPERFMAWSRWGAPMFGAIAVALGLAGLWFGWTAPPVYLIPFGLMTFAYMSAFGSLWLVRIRGEVWRRRAEALALRAARG